MLEENPRHGHGFTCTWFLWEPVQRSFKEFCSHKRFCKREKELPWAGWTIFPPAFSGSTFCGCCTLVWRGFFIDFDKKLSLGVWWWRSTWGFLFSFSSSSARALHRHSPALRTGVFWAWSPVVTGKNSNEQHPSALLLLASCSEVKQLFILSRSFSTTFSELSTVWCLWPKDGVSQIVATPLELSHSLPDLHGVWWGLSPSGITSCFSEAGKVWWWALCLWVFNFLRGGVVLSCVLLGTFSPSCFALVRVIRTDFSCSSLSAFASIEFDWGMSSFTFSTHALTDMGGSSCCTAASTNSFSDLCKWTYCSTYCLRHFSTGSSNKSSTWWSRDSCSIMPHIFLLLFSSYSSSSLSSSFFSVTTCENRPPLALPAPAISVPTSNHALLPQ